MDTIHMRQQRCNGQHLSIILSFFASPLKQHTSSNHSMFSFFPLSNMHGLLIVPGSSKKASRLTVTRSYMNTCTSVDLSHLTSSKKHSENLGSTPLMNQYSQRKISHQAWL